MSESQSLQRRLLSEIMQIRAIDVHSHVPAAQPFARSLRELLGYHYYTELAHSAGMDREVIAPDRPDEDVIPELLAAMEAIDNTVQYSWLIELAQDLFGFVQPRLTPGNWLPLAEAVQAAAARPGRRAEVLALSRIEKVFLTNNFDEDLSVVDTEVFVPSLRADSLVFGMQEASVRGALGLVGGTDVRDAATLQEALGHLVEHFARHGARSAAISLPPGFRTFPHDDGAACRVLLKCFGDRELAQDEVAALHSAVLFALAAACREQGLPLQIMYGVARGAYRHAVPQGADLPQAGDSLRGLLPLFNAFPNVTFLVSALSFSQVQELNSFGWILPNVVLSGHWWYLNVPEYIAFDLAARIQSVPKTKLIGYYSDMYKLEFGLAKFNMYRRVLTHVLAGHFVEAGMGTEEDAVAIARLLLRGNAERIFRL